MNIHHVGYYVTDIDEAQNEFLSLGYAKERECVFDEERKIHVQFLKNGAYRVELIAPAEDCTLFPKSIKKVGATPYHICYECKDLEQDIEEWQGKGFVLVRPPSRAVAIGNHRVAFLYSDAIGMVEFVEI